MLAWLLTVALAQDADRSNRSAAADTSNVPAWSSKTFSRPDTTVEVLCAQATPGENQCLTIHLTGGADAGVAFDYNRDKLWFGEVRAGARFRYGLLSNGWGIAGTVGSFWGLDDEHWRATLGPVITADLYQGLDYRLDPGVGLGWQAQGTLMPLEKLWLIGTFTPSTQFVGSRAGVDRRRSNFFGVSLLDEINGSVFLEFQGPPVIRAGYVYRRNAAGVQHGFAIGGTF